MNVNGMNRQTATVMVATAHIITEYGSFNRIRQVAPICTAI